MTNIETAEHKTVSVTSTYICIMASAFAMLAAVGIAFAAETYERAPLRVAQSKVTQCETANAQAVIGPRGTWKCILPQ